jgi:DNA-binding FrmR family transcriptional regulator
MQGIIDMMEQDHACMDIVTQLKAVRSSIDKSIGILTTENLKQILVEQKDLDSAQVEEAIKIIIKGI